MRVPAAICLILALLILGACKPPEPAEAPSDGPPAAPAEAPPDLNLPPDPDAQGRHGSRAQAPAPAVILAPFPYTPEQLRESSPSGRVCMFRVTDPRGETLTRMEFAEADESGVIVRAKTVTAEGEGVGQTETRSSWEELMRHASYEAALTTITSAEVTVAAGTFQTKFYEVEEPSGGIDMRLWFADGLAGPPVKLEDLQDGEVVVSMELMDNALTGSN